MGKRTVVFTNGVFDLFHFGHLKFLQRCAQMGRLIVGVNSDESVKLLGKGADRPIIPGWQRERIVANLKCVRAVYPFDDPTPCELIKQLRPDIVVKGPGYSIENMPEAAIVKEYGGQVVILDGSDISTTKIIERIKGLA